MRKTRGKEIEHWGAAQYVRLQPRVGMMSGVTNVGVETEMKSCVYFSSSRSFWLGDAHQLDRQLTKPTSSMSLGMSGPGPGKPDPGAVGLRLGEHAVPHVRLADRPAR